MRPRELLQFTKESINVAVNRGHEKVTQDDILQAEKSYSDDLLVDVSFELKDVSPDYSDAPYAFIGSESIISKEKARKRLSDVNVPEHQLGNALELLLWFSFLGIYVNTDDERYSYRFQHDIKKMSRGLDHFSYCIHPGFRKALGCDE